APIEHIPDLPVNCKCEPVRGSCGSSASGPSGCDATQREYDYNCVPQGCNGADADFYCKSDSTCCVSEPQGCGSMSCPAGSGCTGLAGDAIVTASGGHDCYLGYRLENGVCGSEGAGGSGSNKYQCKACSDLDSSGCGGLDLHCPLPACTGP